MSFATAIVLVLKEEGGYVNDPRDPGGETKFGISKRAYPALDIAHLTADQAGEIYRRDFWDRIRGDELPAGVVPDNWTVVRGAGTGSAVASVGTDSEGSYMDLTITAVDGDYYYVNPDSAATISTRLAAWPAYASYRQYADVEIVSGAGIKRIQTQINFGATILQTPDGSGSTWAAQAQSTGRRMMRTKAISVAKMGTSVSANGGLLIGIVGTSTSVVRIRGVSLRSAGV